MRSILVMAIVLVVNTTLQAENWPQWRGPHFNGSTTAASLPLKWSPTENIAWSVEMPGPSAATPVVWGDRVFVSSTDATNNTLKAMCYSLKSGELLWHHDVGSGVSQDQRSYYSAPSPATDGKVVVFFYGNGELVTYDLDGSKKWGTNLGPFAFQWTFSSSPLLFDGRLYMQVLQRDQQVRGRGGRTNESYLLCLNPNTGEELWRQVRPSDAFMESLEAFTTPVPYVHEGRKEILIAGGDALTGHDAETGSELWRWGTWNPTRIGHWRLVPSPVAGDSVILVCAPKGDPVYAVKAGGSGELGDKGLLWNSRRHRVISSDVPTPAFYDGDFFILNKRPQALSRVDPQTGAIKWTNQNIGRREYEASPTVADGKVYVMNFDGQVRVVDAATGELLSTIEMEPEQRTKDLVRSSIVATQGQLLIRTNSRLYCVGE